jgi:hypothetical protein
MKNILITLGSIFKDILLYASLTLLFISHPYSQEDVKISPISIKAYMDFGHLVSGYSSADEISLDMYPLSRGNVTFTQHATIGESFDVAVGITGLIWWPYSSEVFQQPNQRVMRVKPMVPLARAKWKFGDKDGMNGHIQLGTFPYKYNFEAKNLGEYLYRSGTYPGYLWTTITFLYSWKWYIIL